MSTYSATEPLIAHILYPCQVDCLPLLLCISCLAWATSGQKRKNVHAFCSRRANLSVKLSAIYSSMTAPPPLPPPQQPSYSATQQTKTPIPIVSIYLQHFTPTRGSARLIHLLVIGDSSENGTERRTEVLLVFRSRSTRRNANATQCTRHGA
ncbi:hypothetical protein IWX49DRAFT_390400 [Phyllosticta citricarpa]